MPCAVCALILVPFVGDANLWMMDAIEPPGRQRASCALPKHTGNTLMRPMFVPHLFAASSHKEAMNGRCEQRMHLLRALLTQA